jgi:tRNA pseudouridine55 synthase
MGGPALDGVLVIDKPAGITSHDVVAALRRVLGEPRAGHTGTLDPMATGVLPVLLGRATRLAQFLSGGPKTYEAAISFTFETDTDDASGSRVTSGEAQVDRATLDAALTAFRGTWLQTPPAYSAKKVGGQRAYALARAASPAQLKAAPVTVHELELIALEGPMATFRVVCSPGFYVRALARDLGRAVGTGGHLTALRRLESGPFGIDDAVPLDRVLSDPACGRRRVRPPAVAVGHLPAARIAGPALERARHGADVELSELDPEARSDGAPHVRILAPDGALVAIAVPGTRPGSLHPVVVLM